jgi:hypothetical protein
MNRRKEYESPLAYLASAVLMAVIAVMLVVSLYGMTRTLTRLHVVNGDCQMIADRCNDGPEDE